jgi:O-antigen/teichoic acid export membrane protein
MVLYKWVDRGLGFVSTLILAHVLVPADFGLVQMGTSIIALLLLLTYFGLDTEIYYGKQDDHCNRVHAWSLWLRMSRLRAEFPRLFSLSPLPAALSTVQNVVLSRTPIIPEELVHFLRMRHATSSPAAT